MKSNIIKNPQQTNTKQKSKPNKTKQIKHQNTNTVLTQTEWRFFLMQFKNSKSLRTDDTNPIGKLTKNKEELLWFVLQIFPITILTSAILPGTSVHEVLSDDK